MIIESDGNGGWFIDDVDHLHASIHLTEEWLTEYERHQGPQPKLRWLLKTGGQVEGADVQKMLAGRRPSAKTLKAAPDSDLAVWRKERRANRR